MMKNNEQMIYIHIPFCDRKCYYCNFVSFCFPQIQNDYFEKLWHEIKKRKTNKLITSIFIGGGTPSSVNESYIEKTIKVIRKNFKISKNAEISIECNPQSTNEQKLKAYYDLGINRISFGVQSLDEKKLARLGRFQTVKQVYDAINMAKKVGFSNIGIDLLLGLEGQLESEVIADAKQLIDLGITHISAYMLILEEDTPLYKMVKDKKMILPDDEHTVDIYESLCKFLGKQGFERYEISSFAKEGKLSKHNLGYWQLKEYLGFGVSAHSYVDKYRIANSKNIIDYLQDSNQTKERITKQEYREEVIMLGLRTRFGVNMEFVGKKRIVKQLIKDKFLEIKENNIVICKDKFGVANQIILKLI